MKVVIAGVGTVGKWVASFLSTKSSIKEILLGDIDENKLNDVSARLKNDKISIKKMDVRNVDETANILKDSDLFINCAGYQFNISAMKSALKARVNYMDPGGLFHVTKKQHELNDDFRKEDLLAISCMGGAPGTTNIMARYAVDRLDSVEEIGIFDCIHEIGDENTPINFAWHVDSILDGLSKNPIIFKDGKYIELKPFDGREEIYLPQPLGMTEVIYRIHSEVLSLPISFKDKGVKFVYFKGGHPKKFIEKAKFLIDMGLASKNPVKIGENEISPRELLRHLYNAIDREDEVPEFFGLIRVVVKGKKDNKKMNYVIESSYKTSKGIDLVGIGTALPMVVTAMMMLKNQISQKGVLFPEQCIEPIKFFKNLKKMGVQPPVVRIEQPMI
ncbi:MAG: saccharopine dehydrogenase family protein [Candidatus Helarchaeales archaeon]